MRNFCSKTLILAALAMLGLCGPHGHAQAALLMEEPYGFFGALNPTGHNAMYFERICTQTPVQLRRCQPDEAGVVIARYQGISGYDWVAIPLLPYLYSVDRLAEVPPRVHRDQVSQLRNRYHEAHLLSLGEDLHSGNFVHGGWDQLLGVAYERRIYAFRFDTTEQQDDALIARLNSYRNRSHFELLYNNCADFARVVLNAYFPKGFHRSLFPDAGMTTPRQNAYNLVRYASKHPEIELTVFDISQVPGYRHQSHSAKSVSGSLITTVYAVPIVLVNPYLAGGLFADYLVRGRYHIVPKDTVPLDAETLTALTAPTATTQNLHSDTFQAAGLTTSGSTATQPANSRY